MNGMFSIVKRWRNSRNFTSIFSMACLFIPHPLLNLFYVFFRNGGSDTSPLYGRYCGNRIPRTIPSFSNQLLLFFRSDESRSARGFEVFWDGTSQGEFFTLNWFLIEMNVKRCHTCHISIIEMEKVHFFKGLDQPWLFNNFVSFWILNQT